MIASAVSASHFLLAFQAASSSLYFLDESFEGQFTDVTKSNPSVGECLYAFKAIATTTFFATSPSQPRSHLTIVSTRDLTTCSSLAQTFASRMFITGPTRDDRTGPQHDLTSRIWTGKHQCAASTRALSWPLHSLELRLCNGCEAAFCPPR
jgi:hypothetical protein